MAGGLGPAGAENTLIAFGGRVFPNIWVKSAKFAAADRPSVLQIRAFFSRLRHGFLSDTRKRYQLHFSN